MNMKGHIVLLLLSAPINLSYYAAVWVCFCCSKHTLTHTHTGLMDSTDDDDELEVSLWLVKGHSVCVCVSSRVRTGCFVCWEISASALSVSFMIKYQKQWWAGGPGTCIQGLYDICALAVNVGLDVQKMNLFRRFWLNESERFWPQRGEVNPNRDQECHWTREMMLVPGKLSDSLPDGTDSQEALLCLSGLKAHLKWEQLSLLTLD